MYHLGLLHHLREYWPYGKASGPAPPPLTTRFAILVSISFTLLYVLPFYLSPTTRPSATLSRDSPSVVRARVRSVYLSCAVCTAITIYIFSVPCHLPYWETLRLLGWYPVSLPSIARVLLLTATLFLGPLFERLIIEEGWRDYITGQPLISTLRSSIGWRNYIAGPFTEELLFRSLLLPINLLSPQSIRAGATVSAKTTQHYAGAVILTTPLFFGLAHIHHLYEFRITHPKVHFKFALLQSLFQLGYTTLFGWFAAFVFVRTGNLWAVVLAHSFCNWMGLPRLWGQVERPQRIGKVPVLMGPPYGEEPGGSRDRNGKREEWNGRGRSGSYVRTRGNTETLMQHEDDQAGVGWTISYYVLLVTGAIGFYVGLWPLTTSAGQLADI